LTSGVFNSTRMKSCSLH